MARPQRAQSTRADPTFTQPRHGRPQPPKHRREWPSIWLPLVALVTCLALVPFLLVRLMGSLVAR
jgi:hypothetical protein